MFTNRYSDYSHGLPFVRPRFRNRRTNEEVAMNRDFQMRARRQQEKKECELHDRRREMEERVIYDQHQARLQAMAVKEEQMRQHRAVELYPLWDYNVTENDDDEAEFRIDDDRLYYAKNPSYSQRLKKNERFDTLRGPDGMIAYKVNKEQNLTRSPQSSNGIVMHEFESEKEEASGNCNDVIHESQYKQHESKTTNKKKKKKKKKYKKGQNTEAMKKTKKKRVTIIVEDASDSENEDDFNSPWRNRRPSPGQWIEPVEMYEQKNIACTELN